MTNTSTETKARTIYLRDMEYLVGLRCYVHIIDPFQPSRFELIDFETDAGNRRFAELADRPVEYIFPADDGHHVEIGILAERK